MAESKASGNTCRSCWWQRPRGRKGMEGSFHRFPFCAPGCALAPEQGLLGAFSTFCMLLLKASCCISFCLSLPTCKMGLIPPTSLTSPSSSTQLGQVRSPGILHLRGQGSESGCDSPLPSSCHPLPTLKCLMGLSWSILCSLVPARAQRCLALHDFEFEAAPEAGWQGSSQAGSRASE